MIACTGGAKLKSPDAAEAAAPGEAMTPSLSAALAGLFAHVLAHPEDDTPRLIYADALDDAGEHERAEFIRVQIELWRRGRRSRGRRSRDWELFSLEELPIVNKLRDREWELWIAGFNEWIASLPLTGPCQVSATEQRITWFPRIAGDGIGQSEFSCTFARGFPDWIQCTAADWLVHADALTSMQPLREVVLTTWPSAIWARKVMTDEDERKGGFVAKIALKRLWPTIRFTLPRHPRDWNEPADA